MTERPVTWQMGVTEWPLSRRSLFRTGLATLLIGGPSAEGLVAARPRPSIQAWSAALARLRTAETTLAAAAGEPNEVAYARALGPFYGAIRQLLNTAAPDLAALAMKMGLAADHEAELGREAFRGLLYNEARHLLAVRGIDE